MPTRWYALSDGTPFVVHDIIPPERCIVPVLPGGDGAALVPLEERTERCEHLADRRVGEGAITCSHHLVLAFQIAGIDPSPDEAPLGSAIAAECTPPRQLPLDL